MGMCPSRWGGRGGTAADHEFTAGKMCLQENHEARSWGGPLSSFEIIQVNNLDSLDCSDSSHFHIIKIEISCFNLHCF